jgi:ABC-2 type transport system ATP-binding protein
MSDVMIRTSGLTKSFGDVRALDQVDFEVRNGEVVGFLGPNGAGKSTTMRILTCFISPTSGTAQVHGYDVFDDPLQVRRKIGYLPQRAPLYPEMNVWEYLEFTSQVRGLDAGTFRSRLSKVVEVCGLAQVLGKDIGNLSHGYRQRVGLGQALMHDPPILILDEPTSDLDPNEKAEVIKYIQEIGKDRTILLSTHNLAEVEQACARAIIVSKGRVVADGNLDDIRSRAGAVRYFAGFSSAGNGAPAPSKQAVRDALAALPGATRVTESVAEDGLHRYEIAGSKQGDLRPEIFKLAVDRHWMLLELRRDAQSLDSVFRDLTRVDERADRGSGWRDDSDDASENEKE